MWIIEGLAHDRVGFVTKMHHSTVDGVSGAELLSILFDLEPDPGPVPPPPERLQDDRIPSGLELMSQATLDRAMTPFKITRDLVRTGQRVLNVRKVRIGSEDRPGLGKAALPLSAPRTSFNGALSRRRSVAFTGIGLDDVKRLKSALGVTVNDIVLAVCTGALRNFLIQGGELPDKPLVAVVPVSVRTSTENVRGFQQGLVDVRAAPDPVGRPPRGGGGDPRGDQGSQGGAQRPGGRHPPQLGRTRHPQRVRQCCPALQPDAAGGQASAHRQSGHLQRARVPTSRSTWAAPSSSAGSHWVR